MVDNDITKISTFVFFKIETSNTPWQGFTKITELSCMAVSREDLERATLMTLPPVNKLAFLVNPETDIQSGATDITGIEDEYVWELPTFEESFNRLYTFLAALPKPVCLVAHNGNSFDYKVLMYECSMFSNLSLPNDLLCADSLLGLRRLLKQSEEDQSTQTKLSYKLHDIYKRLCNKESDCVEAEDYTIMLLECVVAKKEFLEWADENCKLISFIKPFRQ